MRRALALPAVALASVLALAGCSTMAQPTMAQPPDAGRGQAGGLATDFGVTRSEITLGALTDYSGPFSELGLGVVEGTGQAKIQYAALRSYAAPHQSGD